MFTARPFVYLGWKEAVLGLYWVASKSFSFIPSAWAESWFKARTEAGCDSYCTPATDLASVQTLVVARGTGLPSLSVKHRKRHAASSTSGLCLFPWLHHPKVEQLVRTRPPPRWLDGELPFLLTLRKTGAPLFTLLLALHLSPFFPLSGFFLSQIYRL